MSSEEPIVLSIGTEETVRLRISNVFTVLVGILIEDLLEDRREYAIDDLVASYPELNYSEASDLYLLLEEVSKRPGSVTEVIAGYGYAILAVKTEVYDARRS